VLVGILISSSKKEILTNNTNGIPAPLGEKENPRENLTLVKGLPTTMGKYTVTYLKDSVHPKKQQWYYHIQFVSKDGKENFTLKPNAFVNYKGNEGLMANPDSRHYWDHDVFTYITSLPNPDKKEDTTSFRAHPVKTGDTVFYSNGFITIQKLNEQGPGTRVDLLGKDGKIYDAELMVFSKTGSTYTVNPRLALAKGEWLSVPDTLQAESLVLQLQKVNADKSFEIGTKESAALLQYVTLKAYKFPFIRILWLGVVITAFGILMSMVRRIQLNRRNDLVAK
jgi:cytochrome c-type biogenesis protein CcmF